MCSGSSNWLLKCAKGSMASSSLHTCREYIGNEISSYRLTYAIKLLTFAMHALKLHHRRVDRTFSASWSPHSKQVYTVLFVMKYQASVMVKN